MSSLQLVQELMSNGEKRCTSPSKMTAKVMPAPISAKGNLAQSNLEEVILKRTFAMYDRNGDGSISNTEFKRLASGIGKRITMEQLDDICVAQAEVLKPDALIVMKKSGRNHQGSYPGTIQN